MKTSHLRAVPDLLYADTAAPSGPGETPDHVLRGMAVAKPANGDLPGRTFDDDESGLEPQVFLDYATNIWGWLESGGLTVEACQREIAYLECGVPRCDSCKVLAGQINDGGFKVCGRCWNGGKR